MNKKSKRITLGLVSALCLLLVVALGFGVTGAWYRARRTASGTIKLDQGINLKVNNLNGGTNENPQLLDSSHLSGYFWELNVVDGDANDSLIILADSSTQPGSTATKYIAVPTIQADAGSTPFYAKAKLVIEYTKYADAQTRTLATGEGATVTLDSLYVKTGENAYRPATIHDIYNTTAAVNETPADLTNSIEFADGWVAVGSYGYMMYGTNATTPTAITATSNAAGSAVPILTDDADDSADAALSTIGFDKVQLKEWTGGDVIAPENYVEFGGPKFYTGSAYDNGTLTSATLFEIGRISYSMIIDVIQSSNLTEAALTAWIAAA